MIRGSITNFAEDEILEGKLPGNVNYGIQGPTGPKGPEGGYYIPAVTQMDENTIQFTFEPSNPDMPVVDPATAELPALEADWNAGEGEPGYILNKPFGEGKTVLAETIIDVDRTVELDTYIPLNVNKKYIVTVNGTDYSNVSVSDYNEKVSLFVYSDTNETILWVNSYEDQLKTDVTVLASDVVGSLGDKCTISIRGNELVKIDPKFLPEDHIIELIQEHAPENGFSVNADWNAAEGEPGHILNRPFYSDYTHQLLLPETVPMYLPGDGLFICDDSVTPAPGTECTVTWNGTEYRCTVQDLSALGMTDVIGIGALDLALSEEGLTGNHEPFAIISGPAHIMAQMGANTIIIALDGSTELTLAIQGIVEAVTLIPQKYLKNARGQKKYTMNLDNGSVDVSVETLMEMDAAEIQSSLTIIYKGHPHNVSIIEMNSEMVGDKPYCWIVFAVDSGYGERTYFQYHNIGGLSLRRTSYDVQYHFSDRLCLYGKPTYENQPVWLELENTPFPGILLSSSTLGSSKKFWITADDKGALYAQQPGQIEKVLIGPGNGGGADWNAAEGEPGYISNRPFYEHKKVILPETTVSNIATINRLGLVIGEEYTVNWNGNEYVCVAEEGQWTIDDVSYKTAKIVVGGIELADFGEIYDSPAEYEYSECNVISFNEVESITLSIVHNEVIKKIDPKFLPEIVLTRKELEAIKEAIVDEVLYTDIEAIKGDAKAYILTDYIPNSNTRVVAKAYFYSTSTERCLFGARTSTSSLRFDFGNNTSSKYSLGWNASTVNSTIAERTEAFELDVNRNVVYINGEEEVRAPDAEWVAAYPLAIFACNTKGTIATNAPSGATIWWMKIYEGDTLLYDFIPRKHLVDGYGLYDKISKKFYSNANTSGTFTEG